MALSVVDGCEGCAANEGGARQNPAVVTGLTCDPVHDDGDGEVAAGVVVV